MNFASMYAYVSLVMAMGIFMGSMMGKMGRVISCIIVGLNMFYYTVSVNNGLFQLLTITLCVGSFAAAIHFFEQAGEKTL